MLPEEKVAPVAEDTGDALESDASESSETKAEMSDRLADALNAQPADGDESESSDADAESPTAEEKADGEDEVKQILKKAEPKDNVQKRFDQLTARLKILEEENQKLKGEKAQEKTKEPEYTDQQLKAALKKAMEDGDSDLVFEIIDYRTKKTERELTKRYEEAEKQKSESVQRINQEWQKVTDDYSRVWEDDKGAEIYPGAKRDLDVSMGDSLLYKVAFDLYHSQDAQGNYIYRVPGGQRMAVADALAAILKQRRLQPQAGKVKQLERTLAKEKRKKSLAGSGSMEEDASPRRAQTAQETLADVLAERKKYQNERGR